MLFDMLYLSIIKSKNSPAIERNYVAAYRKLSKFSSLSRLSTIYIGSVILDDLPEKTQGGDSTLYDFHDSTDTLKF